MQSRLLENGHLNKVVPVKPPPVERFPIKVEDLEDYIMDRRNNNNEELRNEYRVDSEWLHISVSDCLLYLSPDVESDLCVDERYRLLLWLETDQRNERT